ncbi:hypothetical protein LWI29_025701 [Acer saccharum]|uniref:Uncharacterized protein n=1 Tax=Acer saccharum TaxID=4024 RepID=A0AA39W0E6_ACESA|nr:hypothetical protein LWI29_025701 [Acer saccharum]
MCPRGNYKIKLRHQLENPSRRGFLEETARSICKFILAEPIRRARPEDSTKSNRDHKLAETDLLLQTASSYLQIQIIEVSQNLLPIHICYFQPVESIYEFQLTDLCQKGSFSGSGTEPDLGPVAGRDYEPFMPTEDEAVIWPSDEEIEDEEDSEGPPAAG